MAMEVTKDLIVDDHYGLKISSKKLMSGRFQVKFYATVKESKELYGYLLVEPEDSLKYVVGKIRERLDILNHAVEYRHFHLYDLGTENQEDPNFLIFA